MTPLITIPIGEFFTKNLMPYFQPPTRNPPLGFGNSRGGIPTRGGGSPPHGSGAWPPRGGSRPLGGGGGPLNGSGPPSGSRPPNGERPLRGGGGWFPVGNTSVLFNVPWPSSPWNPWYPTMVFTTNTHYPCGSFINKIIAMPNLLYWDRFGCSCLSVSKSHSS